ncbi:MULTISPECIES: hypothetical protein [Rhizobium]|jgi:hypothetical protein|uniref:hypothetical protein n=1 Tax=Rhizobium TaxID=379 RepID=UPI00047745DE|nr:hypothetical protein [Rhizobium leguminosarum]MBA8834475.1 hypothetical protein [Rhizobium leguminosarum]MBY5913171.1 hypothetical protein [Rhizobium leguminosarum]MDH6272825.1 hypothetical protein [Rhizobium leguminosarum]MVO95814.1 hypothetical protein [Rhizobium leguminosarum bv. phaseoli]
MILALNTAQAERGNAFDSGTQRVTSPIVAKEKPDWRKNRKQHQRITETPSATGSIVLLMRHRSEISRFEPFTPKMFISRGQPLTN